MSIEETLAVNIFLNCFVSKAFHWKGSCSQELGKDDSSLNGLPITHNYVIYPSLIN